MSFKVTVILLAGGSGKRMKTDLPKQFLPLHGKPIARYSFDLFASLPEVEKIVVVCAEAYRSYFEKTLSTPSISFAQPGQERQDSVFNGLQAVSNPNSLICIHDAARPFIAKGELERALWEANQTGAAALAVPVKVTIKETDEKCFVKKTLPRAQLWEIQTPQIIRYPLLVEAYAHAKRQQLSVTDDVSLVEALGQPVKLVEGSYKNLKITTPEDLSLAELLFSLSY